MSKLATVRSALQNDHRLQIVSASEQTHFPHPHLGWTHKVNFVVAPTTGIYTDKELQKFMLSLVPGLAPTTSDRFMGWDTRLELGRLYFDENIGSEVIRHEITLNESDFLPADVVENGQADFEETRALRRRIWVRPYPDIEIAMVAEKYEFSMPQADLNGFRSKGRRLGFISRIGDVLGA